MCLAHETKIRAHADLFFRQFEWYFKYFSILVSIQKVIGQLTFRNISKMVGNFRIWFFKNLLEFPREKKNTWLEIILIYFYKFNLHEIVFVVTFFYSYFVVLLIFFNSAHFIWFRFVEIISHKSYGFY